MHCIDDFQSVTKSFSQQYISKKQVQKIINFQNHNLKLTYFLKKKVKKIKISHEFLTHVKKVMLRLYASSQSFLKEVEPSTFGLSPMLYPWATGTWGLFVFVVGWG